MRASFTTLFLFICLISFSQYTDFANWMSIKAQHPFNKKTKASLEQEFRWMPDQWLLDKTFTQAEIEYELLKDFNITGGYRFIFSPNSFSHRLSSRVDYSIEKRKWQLKPSVLYEWEKDPDKIVADNYLRPKATVSYKLKKKWEPYLGAEFFYRIFYYKGDLFNQYRLGGGISYELTKQETLKFFYLYEREYNIIKPGRKHIAGIAFTIEI